MNYFSLKLRKLRENKGLSQRALGEQLGLLQQTYGRYEKGTAQPDYDTLNKIANFYDVSIDYLIGESEKSSDKLNKDVVRINVLGSVPAGIPLEAIEDIIDWEEIPSDWKGEYFGLKIKGNSMYPKYLDGDTVIFKKQEDVDCGKNALVYVNGYDATFKKVIKNENGSIILQPLNPEHSPIVVQDDETFRVAGVPVEIRRKHDL